MIGYQQTSRDSNDDEEFFRTVFDQAAVGIARVSPDGTFLQLNSKFCSIVGYDKEELLGLTFQDITHPDDLLLDEDFISRVISGRIDSFEIEKRYIHKNGHIVWIKLCSNAVRNPDGIVNYAVAFITDITERVKALKDLERSRQELQRTLNATTDGIWTWNFKTEELAFSPKYYKMLGYEPDEFPSDYESWVNLLHPEDREKTLTAATDYLKTKPDNYENEFRLRAKDGSYRWIKTRARVVERDENDDAVFMIGNHEDITASRVAEQKIRDSEGRFRLLIESAPISVMMLQNGKYIYANPSGAQMMGFDSPADLIGVSALETIAPDFREIIAERIKNINQNKSNAPFELKLVKPNGEYVWSLSTSVPMMIDGKPTAVIMGQNITESRKAEIALKENEEKYRKLVLTAPYGIQLTDTEGKIIFSNPAHHQIQGYDDGELIGKYIWELMADDEHKQAAKNFYRRIIEERPVPEVYYNRDITRDGREIDVQVNWDYIFDENSEIEGIISIITDITEQKLLESTLRQAQKMESIGTLAGGIAHDFNNILSPIMIHCEMAMDDLPSGDPLLHDMKEIHKAAERLRDLVKQILTIARKKEEKKIIIKTSPIIKEAVKFLRSTIPTTIDIQLITRAESDSILADPTQVSQIIMNLCTNAAHAMKEKGGSIKVTLENEEIHTGEAERFPNLEPGKYLKLSVKDTGAGINPDYLEKIFEPYFTTKEVGEGTGLGLSIIHGIVHSYGGEIFVDSSIGEGTCFTIYLPLAEENTLQEEKKRHVLQKGKNERILLVDDEKPAVEALDKSLERLGYSVTARTDSKEALELFKTDPDSFDIVITDMTMPNMTGDILAEEIMNIKPGTPVILCTGFSDKIDEKKAKEMGIRGFIMKPVVLSEMADTIRELLER